jgi:Ca2+-dependent lipid-binding protein
VAKDVTGKSDPYVLISAKDGEWASPARRTRTIVYSLNPDWDEKLHFTIPLAHIDGQLHVQVWDRDMFKPDDFMGEFFLQLNQQVCVETITYVGDSFSGYHVFPTFSAHSLTHTHTLITN